MSDKVVEIKEKPKNSRTRLLFHGTELPGAEGFIKEHGLLASEATLTPQIELALYYGRSSFLTVWYPLKREVENFSESIIGLTPDLTEENRAKIKKAIEESNEISPKTKEFYLNFMKLAILTHLPSSRLGAVINLTEDVEKLLHSWSGSNPIERGNIADYEPATIEEQVRFLEDYAANKDKIVGDLEKILDRAKVEYFDPTLNNNKLAEDIAKTKLEHYLTNLARLLSRARKYPYPHTRARLPKNFRELELIQFNEPLYERYRRMLVSGIKDVLKQ